MGLLTQTRGHIMVLIQFVVHRNGEKWCVRSTGLERSFADEAAATTAAVELAHHSGKNGKPAVVVAELPGGALQTIWTYGQDEYPLAQSATHAAAGESTDARVVDAPTRTPHT